MSIVIVLHVFTIMNYCMYNIMYTCVTNQLSENHWLLLLAFVRNSRTFQLATLHPKVLQCSMPDQLFHQQLASHQVDNKFELHTISEIKCAGIPLQPY